MKRYLVFAYDSEGALGGWNDFKGDFVHVDAAIAFADKIHDRYNGATVVIDLDTKQDIYIYPMFRKA